MVPSPIQCCKSNIYCLNKHSDTTRDKGMFQAISSQVADTGFDRCADTESRMVKSKISDSYND